MCCVESTVDNGMQFKYCIVFLCHLSRSKSWWKDFLYKYWKYFFQSFCRKIFLPRRSILPAFILGLCPSSLQNQFKWQSPWCIYTLWVFPIVLWKLRISSFTWHHHPWIEFENVEKLTFYYLNLLELIWTDLNWFQRRPVSIVCSSPSNLLLLFDFLHTTRHCRASLLVFQMVSIDFNKF